jgi:hypothetical protein
MLIDPTPATIAATGEMNLRRQIDKSVSRALVDADYARLLLSDPTVVLEDQGCPLQQYKALRSIRADTLFDLAQQALALFWAVGPSREHLDQEESLQLATAAAR